MTDPESRSPDADPKQTANPPDPARYTAQQEKEMGATDESGRTIQPQGAFLLIGWTYVLAAGVGAVIVAIILRMTSGPPGGQ